LRVEPFRTPQANRPDFYEGSNDLRGKGWERWDWYELSRARGELC